MNDTLFIFLQMKTPYFGPFGILFPVADFIGQVPVVKTSFRIRYELHIMLCDLLAHLTQRIVVSYIQASASISVGIHKFDKPLKLDEK
jgi:hypothetical protein